MVADSSLKIVMIADHCCVRVIKQSVALSQMGYELHLISNKLPLGKGVFKTTTQWMDGKHLKSSIQNFDDSYIFHVHNEPSWPVTVVRETFPNARLVFDVHDSNYFRAEDEGLSWYEEDVAAHLADGLIFVSESYQKRFLKIVGVDKPNCVLPSASPESWNRYGPWNHMGGIVSMGGHFVPEEGWKGEANRWRDYTEIYEQLVAAKKLVFAYSAEFKDTESPCVKYYQELGARLGTFSHLDMLEHMGGHDWSLAGNLGDSPVWKYALPNKFFDALSAGIPVVNFNCPEVAKLIDEYDVGINVSSVKEFTESWGTYREKRANVFRRRGELSMERFIERSIALYKEL